MKHLKIALLSLLSAMSLVLVKAQTADEIVNKWMTAMGGREKLASIKSAYMENELTIMNNPASCKTYLLAGKGYKNETDFGGQIIIDCYTPNGGWNVNPLAGQPKATPMPESQVKLGSLQLDPAGPLFNYAAKGSKIELLGKEKLNNGSAYKIKLVTAAGAEAMLYISDSSYYIIKNVVKMTANGQEFEISTDLSDYRKTADGYVMPFSFDTTVPGLSFSISIKKVEVNKQIDPAIFDMPKS